MFKIFIFKILTGSIQVNAMYMNCLPVIFIYYRLITNCIVYSPKSSFKGKQ